MSYHRSPIIRGKLQHQTINNGENWLHRKSVLLTAACWSALKRMAVTQKRTESDVLQSILQIAEMASKPTAQ